MSENNEKTFVVKDKRRFNSEGEEQSSVDSNANSTVESGNKTSTTQIPTSDTSANDKLNKVEGEAITFPSFLMSLAMQALMQLGEIPAPQGSNIPKDKIAAKQTIDVIAMLKEKTKGNLDKDEEKMIEEVLHNLRMSFLRA